MCFRKNHQKNTHKEQITKDLDLSTTELEDQINELKEWNFHANTPTYLTSGKTLPFFKNLNRHPLALIFLRSLQLAFSLIIIIAVITSSHIQTSIMSLLVLLFILIMSLVFIIKGIKLLILKRK